MNWIERVTNSTRYSESPERYFYWSAVACISATVKKNVYLDRHMYKLYPNVYVMLISAKSGLRKGIPIALASGILSEVGNTKIITGRNSIQGVIKELSLQTTLESGVILAEAQGILLSDEFASFIIEDPSAMTILTGLHNTHEHNGGWKNSLKNSPVETLKNPCITMIGASNEVLFDDIIQGKDIEGGFIARTFIVYESKRRLINSLMTKPEGLVPKKDLAEYLKVVSQVKGQFTMNQRAKNDYDKWYINLSERDIDDRTGTLERLGDQVLKLAMLISLGKDISLEIDQDTLDEAIFKAQECFGGTKHVSMGQGKSESAAAVAKVLKLLLVSPEQKLSRKRVLEKLWPDVDAVNLDRVVDTLIQSGAIESSFEGKQMWYKMHKKIYNQYVNFQKELEN